MKKEFFTVQEKAEIKSELFKMRESLEYNKKSTLETFSDNLEEDIIEDVDRANIENQRNLTLFLRERESKLDSKIDKVINRLHNNEYHICENCGEEISKSRLKARPVTTLCLECKTDQEKREKYSS